MNRQQAEELWLRFLASKKLAPEEANALLKTLQEDDELRRELLGDLEIDGLLRNLGRQPE